MKRSIVALAVFGLLGILVNCGGTAGEQTGSSEEQDLKACTKMPLYCPPGCSYEGHACPQQCHCPQNVNCGPTLHCSANEQCCTAGPINVDPTLNNYMCVSSGTACPL